MTLNRGVAFLLLIATLVVTGCATTGGRPNDWRSDDFTWIRGMNYTPSYAPNDIVTWRDFDARVINQELALAEKLGLNSIRTWLSFTAYEHNPEKFNMDLETFLTIADSHGLTVMPVIFDSCFGSQTPTIDWDGYWVPNPGPAKEIPEFSAMLQPYVEDIVKQHKGDKRIVMWDVMNEPTLHGPNIDFVGYWCQTIRDMDPTHPVTVGYAFGSSMVQTLAEYQDVLSYHCYADSGLAIRYQAKLMREMSESLDKPVVITEFCSPGWGQPYELAMPPIRDAGIGWYAWELIIGKNQFNRVSGLLYPDGTCRRTTEVAAVMNVSPNKVPFKQKPDDEGIRHVVRWEERFELTEAYLAKLKAMAATPTTLDNYDERKAFFMPWSLRLATIMHYSWDELSAGYLAAARIRVTDTPTEDACKAMDVLLQNAARHCDEIDMDLVKHWIESFEPEG